MSPRTSPSSPFMPWVAHALACAIVLLGCEKKEAQPRGGAPTKGASVGATASVSAKPASAAAPLTLSVVFSSEKKDWASAAIKEFNALGVQTGDGRRIDVKVTYSGSIEPIDGIVAGTIKPHVFSPAASAVVPLLVDAWTGAKGVSERPIAQGGGDPLVLSPVVVAMWEPMATALGWPAKKIGWADVAALAKSADGWKAKGHPEWGDFRFGHTHPGLSNSGLIGLLAENYAGAGKTRDLQAADITATKTMDFVRGIEGAVVHYGRSTGFFYDALVGHGPSYLSAAVLYENLVVASTSGAGAKLPFPLVCVYPKEGTQWADHPYLVLDAPWVGVAERDAAAKLKAHLLSRPLQERAMKQYGFRPALTDIPLAAPIDKEHGADPKEPQTLLATPDGRTLRALLDSWKETKRGVDVVVVLDRSGSMQGARINGARDGLVRFLGTLRPTDRATLLTFSDVIDPPPPPSPPAALVPKAKSVFAEGGTALYDAVLWARDAAERSAKGDKKRIHAVVVLTDGEDTDSKLTLDKLMDKLTPAEKGGSVRIFTIGYGAEANESILKGIAVRSGGAYYHGDVADIKAVYDEISAFF